MQVDVKTMSRASGSPPLLITPYPQLVHLRGMSSALVLFLLVFGSYEPLPRRPSHAGPTYFMERESAHLQKLDVPPTWNMSASCSSCAARSPDRGQRRQDAQGL